MCCLALVGCEGFHQHSPNSIESRVGNNSTPVLRVPKLAKGAPDFDMTMHASCTVVRLISHPDRECSKIKPLVLYSTCICTQSHGCDRPTDPLHFFCVLLCTREGEILCFYKSCHTLPVYMILKKTQDFKSLTHIILMLQILRVCYTFLYAYYYIKILIRIHVALVVHVQCVCIYPILP